MPLSEEIYKRIRSVTAKQFDDTLKANAENASNAGVEVRVTREYDGVGLSNGRICHWCLSRCGINMTLDEANSKGAFERHDGCGCIIEYVSVKGLKAYQMGKSSPGDWLSEEEFQKRVDHGLDGRALTPGERIINAAIEMQVRDKQSMTLVEAIIDNHDALKHYTPEEMKRRLERAGHKVTALKRGSLRNKPFEKGGGYIINFGGDGAFQYHPEAIDKKREHHKGAYWKISGGEKGSHRYNIDGTEKYD